MSREKSPSILLAALGSAQTPHLTPAWNPSSRRKLQSPALFQAIDRSEQALAIGQMFSRAAATAPGTRRSAQSPSSPARNIRWRVDWRCALPTARDCDIRMAPPNAHESPRSTEFRPAAKVSPAKSLFSAPIVPRPECAGNFSPRNFEVDGTARLLTPPEPKAPPG